MDAWTEARQAETKITATNHGATWTSSDMAKITDSGETITSLAKITGRTYLAVSTMKTAITAGKINTDKITAPRLARSDRPYRGWVEGMIDE